jgi:hypothetical protein
MKKILYIFIALVALFALVGCDTALHNGDAVIITKVEVINIPEKYEGQEIYIHEGWMPGNTWDNLTPNKATVTDGKITIVFETPAVVKEENLKVQVIRAHWDDKVVGDEYEKLPNPYDQGTYYIEVDAKTKKGVLKTE